MTRSVFCGNSYPPDMIIGSYLEVLTFRILHSLIYAISRPHLSSRIHGLRGVWSTRHFDECNVRSTRGDAIRDGTVCYLLYAILLPSTLPTHKRGINYTREFSVPKHRHRIHPDSCKTPQILGRESYINLEPNNFKWRQAPKNVGLSLSSFFYHQSSYIGRISFSNEKDREIKLCS